MKRKRKINTTLQHFLSRHEYSIDKWSHRTRLRVKFRDIRKLSHVTMPKLALENSRQPARRMFPISLLGWELGDDVALTRHTVSVVDALEEYREASVPGSRSGTVRLKVLKGKRIAAILCVNLSAASASGEHRCLLCRQVDAGCCCPAVLLANGRGVCLERGQNGAIQLWAQVSEKMTAKVLRRYENFSLTASAYVYESASASPAKVDFQAASLSILPKSSTKRPAKRVGPKPLAYRAAKMAYDSRGLTTDQCSAALHTASAIQEEVSRLVRPTASPDRFNGCKPRLSSLLHRLGHLLGLDAAAFPPPVGGDGANPRHIAAADPASLEPLVSLDFETASAGLQPFNGTYSEHEDDWLCSWSANMLNDLMTLEVVDANRLPPLAMVAPAGLLL